MPRRRPLAPLLLLALAAGPGCVSLVTADTGRARESGSTEWMTAFTSGAFSETSLDGPRDRVGYDPEEEASIYHSGGVLEVGVTYGLDGRTDLRLRGNTTLFAAAGLKRQVLGTDTSPVAASVGLDAGFNAGVIATTIAYGYVSVPVIVSVHPDRRVALYAAPRYTAVGAAGLYSNPETDEEARPPTAWHYPGLAYGVVLGERLRFVLEVGHYRRDLAEPSQISAGVLVPLGGR